MNAAQLHLMLNHIPSIGVIIGLLTFIIGWLRGLDSVRKTGAWIILLAGIMVWPASFTGEEAEELIEDLPGVQKNLMEQHEDAAGQAFVMTLISAAMALSYLLSVKLKQSLSKITSFVLVISCIVALGLILNASHKGGLIRHPELVSGNSVLTPGNVNNDEEEDD
jgi:uncharacterized membrane protein